VTIQLCGTFGSPPGTIPAIAEAVERRQRCFLPFPPLSGGKLFSIRAISVSFFPNGMLQGLCERPLSLFLPLRCQQDLEIERSMSPLPLFRRRAMS